MQIHHEYEGMMILKYVTMSPLFLSLAIPNPILKEPFLSEAEIISPATAQMMMMMMKKNVMLYCIGKAVPPQRSLENV